jgi:DNA-binding FadR family transcriptional regulator
MVRNQGAARTLRSGATGAVDQSLVEKVRRYIQDGSFAHNQRLPPERRLCEILGLSRSALRKALAEVESDGLIWRHVGRGTFVGARPVHNLDDIAFLGGLADPVQVLDARAAIEPELARLAAVKGNRTDLEAIRECNRRCREAQDWRRYEVWDNNFHLAVAKATHNKVLIYLFETLNVVRRSIVWGQRRATTGPATDHFSFGQHDATISMIEARDGAGAAATMRKHISAVRERVIPAMK